MTPSNTGPADKHTTQRTAIQRLREPLHAKIAELKQRSSSEKSTDGDVVVRVRTLIILLKSPSVAEKRKVWKNS
jgi:hypothetical protein